MLRMPMPLWLTTRVLLEHRLVEGQRILRMDQEGLRLVAVDDLLHGERRLAPLLAVELGALLLGQLVVFGIDVADEVVALLGVARMVEAVEELVGIAAFGPADHAPHRGVPLVAAEPDELGLRLALQRLDVDLQPELAPLLGDQLRRLIALRQGRLRPGVEVDLAHLLGRALRKGRRRQSQRGQSDRRSNRELPHDASFARAGRAWRVYRFSGTRKPKFSRNVLPSYSVRKMPRRCSSGTTRRQKSSNGLG